jgi:large subunit ribosomal protein L30
MAMATQQRGAKNEKGAARIRIRQVRSTIGFNRKQAVVIESMGLRRMGHTVELADTPETRGMIHKVRHLVEVVE